MQQRRTRRLVLDEDNANGRKHILESTGEMAVEETPNSTKITLSKDAILLHHRHDRMILGRGRYRCYHQVELNPMDSTIGRVFD